MPYSYTTNTDYTFSLVTPPELVSTVWFNLVPSSFCGANMIYVNPALGTGQNGVRKLVGQLWPRGNWY